MKLTADGGWLKWTGWDVEVWHGFIPLQVPYLSLWLELHSVHKSQLLLQYWAVFFSSSTQTAVFTLKGGVIFDHWCCLRAFFWGGGGGVGTWTACALSRCLRSSTRLMRSKFLRSVISKCVNQNKDYVKPSSGNLWSDIKWGSLYE